MNRIIKLSLYGLLLLPLMGCMKEIDQVRMGDIDLINKNYPKQNENNNLAFAYAEPEVTIIADISQELRNGLKERIQYAGGRVKCHLNNELDKIILAKGFTITDRFRSINYMTFSEKRNTTALFYPEIKIHIIEKSHLDSSNYPNFQTMGTLEIDANVNIIMREPMSQEIIWIKSIPVQEIADSFQYDNAYWAGPYGNNMMLNTQHFRVGRGQKHHVPENLAVIGEKIDTIFTEIDRKIIEATNHFVEAEEFTFLNTDIKKLKKLDRY